MTSGRWYYSGSPCEGPADVGCCSTARGVALLGVRAASGGAPGGAAMTFFARAILARAGRITMTSGNATSSDVRP